MALTDKPTTLSGTHQGTGICCNLVENTAGVGFFPWAICRSPLGHLSKEFSRVIVCLLPHAAFKLNSMQEVPPLTRWGANFSNLPQPGALLNLPERKARGGISSPPAGEGAQTAGQAELRVAVARSSALPACPPRSQVRQPSEPLQPLPPRGQPPTPTSTPTPRAGRLAADRGGRACSCSAAAARSRFTDSAAPPRSFILQLIHSEGSGRLRLGPIPRRRSVRQFISGRVQCVSGREGAREARFS